MTGFRRASLAVQAAIGAMLAVAVVLALVGLSRRADLGALAAHESGAIDAVLRGDRIGPRVGWALVAAGLCHAAAFGWFFHQSHRAIERSTGNHDGARLGAASFFIPMANLVLPYLSAKAVLDHGRAEAGGLLLAWWLPFVAAVGVRTWAVVTFDAAVDDGDIDGARSALLLDTIGCLVLAGSLVVAIAVVARMIAAVAPRPVETSPVP